MAINRLFLKLLKQRSFRPGLILTAVFSALLLNCADLSFGQVAETPAPGLDTSVGPDEVQRLEKKRALEAALPKIREAYLKGDYQEVLKGVAEAEKIDPTNGSVRFYKEMARMRLSSGETPTVRTRVVPRPDAVESSGKGEPTAGTSQRREPGGFPPLTAATSVTPNADSATADRPSPESSANQGGASSEPDSSKPGLWQRISSSKPLLYGGLALVLLVAGGGIFIKIRNRKAGGEEEEEEEEEEDEEEELPGGAAAAPAMGLHGGFGLSGLPRRPDDDTIVDPDDIAQQMAGYTPSEQAPTFDIFSSPSDEDAFAGSHGDSMPTAVEEEGRAAEDDRETPHAQGPVEAPPAPAEDHRPMFDAPPAAPAAPSPGAAHAGETVSFDDLGIFLSDDPKPAVPEKPAVVPPVQGTPGGHPVSPSEMFSKDSGGKDKGWGIDSISLSDPNTQPTAPAAPAGAPIKLEEIALKQAGAQKTPNAPAPLAEKPPGTIDLEDLLFGDLEATLGKTSSPAAESPARAVSAQAPDPAGFNAIDTSWSKPSAESPGALDATATASSETIHSQDTVQIPPPGRASAPDREIEPYKHPNDALDATVGMGEKKQGSESPYGSPSKAGTQLDERSEKMFREQFDRAMKAVGEKNWKQAVHYLSIAAAIHPENSDVREKLREAREQKRKQEVSA